MASIPVCQWMYSDTVHPLTYRYGGHTGMASIPVWPPLNNINTWPTQGT